MQKVSCPNCKSVAEPKFNNVCGTCGILFSDTSFINHLAVKVTNPKAIIKIQAGCTIGEDGFNFSQDKNGVYTPKEHSKVIEFLGNAWIGAQTNIHRGLYSNTIIGEGFICDAHVYIAHDVKIGKNVRVNAGAIILGEVEIGDFSVIWAGSIIQQKTKIGCNAHVGANSYLRHNVKNNEVWYGSPATKIERDKIHYPAKIFL